MGISTPGPVRVSQEREGRLRPTRPKPWKGEAEAGRSRACRPSPRHGDAGTRPQGHREPMVRIQRPSAAPRKKALARDLRPGVSSAWGARSCDISRFLVLALSASTEGTRGTSYICLTEHLAPPTGTRQPPRRRGGSGWVAMRTRDRHRLSGAQGGCGEKSKGPSSALGENKHPRDTGSGGKGSRFRVGTRAGSWRGAPLDMLSPPGPQMTRL